MKSLFVALVLLFSTVTTLKAAELFGHAEAVTGSVKLKDAAGKVLPLAQNASIFEGQDIITGADGEVEIATEDSGLIALRANTQFHVDAYQANGESGDKIFMRLITGSMRSITGWIGKHDHAAYRLTTPTATIGIRGTDHETTVIDEDGDDEAGTYDTVNEGGTTLTTPQGVTDVEPGKHAFAAKRAGFAPRLLADRPKFWAKRQWKLEARINARKAFFHDRLEQMRDEKIQRFKAKKLQRMGLGDASDDGRLRDLSENKADRKADKQAAMRELREARQARQEIIRDARRDRMEAKKNKGPHRE